MIIDESDLKAVLARVRDAFAGGLPSVMSPIGFTRPQALYFFSDSFDMALFYNDHPLDAEKFKEYDVRAVYEATVMLSKGKEDVFSFCKRTDAVGNSMLDLDKLLDFRKAERDLAQKLGRFNWHRPWGQPFQSEPQFQPDEQLMDVLAQMEQLSQTSMGRQRMVRLWESIVPDRFTRPYFLDTSERIGNVMSGAIRMPPSKQAPPASVAHQRQHKRQNRPRLK